jgi:hypothetical protein
MEWINSKVNVKRFPRCLFMTSTATSVWQGCEVNMIAQGLLAVGMTKGCIY